MNEKLEQRIIMKFLWSNGTNPVEIHSRLLQACQKDVYTLSSVYEWIRAFKTGSTSVLDEHRAGRPRFDNIYSTVLSVFHENEFHSIQTLAQKLRVCLNRVYDRGMNWFGFSLRNARWVLDLLTQELKAERVTNSTEMLRILQTYEPTNFARIITGDKSWFFLEYFQNRVWSLGEETPPEWVSQKLKLRSTCSESFGPLWVSWSRNGCQNMKHFITYTSVKLLFPLNKCCISWLGETAQTTSLHPYEQCQISQFRKFSPMHQRQQLQKDVPSTIFASYCTEWLLSFWQCEAAPANLPGSPTRRTTRECTRDSGFYRIH
jgi:hypothetical protein